MSNEQQFLEKFKQAYKGKVISMEEWKKQKEEEKRQEIYKKILNRK